METELPLDLQAFIRNAYWKPTKKDGEYARHPHAYTLRKWNSRYNELFDKLVIYIRTHGVEEKFYSKSFMYLYFEGHKYWTMGAPLEDTILINRVVV
jgi:hypothetical protein